MTSINPIDYFNTTQLPEQYDFNKDGKIDISDYNYAVTTLQDTDPDNDVAFKKDELDKVFATIIQDAMDENDQSIDEQNAKEQADTIIAVMKNGTLSPDNATSLTNLQLIGKNLTKYIKQSADIAKVLAKLIEEKEAELEKTQEEKDEKEKEYLGRVQEVEQKNTELAARISEVLAASQSMSEQRRVQAESIIKQTVNDYKDGKYPNKQLHEIIKYNLTAIGGYNTSLLARQLNATTSLGEEIKSICSSIDSLVGDIKTVTEKFNSQTSEINSLKDSRTGVLDAANKASQEYQKGYQKRLDMRQAIVDQYHVERNGQKSCTTANPQVQMLAKFLDNKELDNMPYADAWNILQATFNDCGIKFKGDGVISVPKGHDSTAKNIYNALVDAIKRNYSSATVSQYDEDGDGEGYVDPTTDYGGTTQVKVKRRDPITFTDGDIKYDFINDDNNNGILDDASEFMGATSGWAEMQAYDKNGDGKLAGDELKDLKMVANNQTNGQFTFTNAFDAGITSIDLNSYQKQKNMAINGDITVGSFNIQMNGQQIKGFQTEDTEQNLNNKYATFFGAKIEDLSDTYEMNPFMEDMEEKVNTKDVETTAQSDINRNKQDAAMVLKKAENRDKKAASKAAARGTLEKQALDKQTEKEKQIQTEKAEEKKQEEQAEEDKKTIKKEK